MKKLLLIITLSLFLQYCFAQLHPDFIIKHLVKTTPVKNQQQTGTCWAYATISFLETELLRTKKEEFDLSEMFIVRNTYPDKAIYHVRLHGKNNFSQGGQAHDVTNVIKKYGIVPESVYKGKKYKGNSHNHSKLEKDLKNIIERPAKETTYLDRIWIKIFNAILDNYMGKVPEKFTYKNKEYSPISFADEVINFNYDDYIEFTSYSHHPYYEKFDLEVPDNWSHDEYFNVPVEELMEIMDNALQNGYSISWDGDVSETNFSHKDGTAKLEDEDIKEIKTNSYQEYRQITFENFTSTDDHLMHITGIAEGKDGTVYYKTKNSWGKESNNYGGYLYMSRKYVMIKTVAFMVHKDAVPKKILKKIKL